MLLDTNIVIYACKPGGDFLSPWTTHPDAAVASVTRIESLGFARISSEEDNAIREFLSQCVVYPLDDDVIERAVTLRQQQQMKLGDAVIAATALEYGIPLVTRNTVDFDHIPGLTLIDPFAAPPAAAP